MSNEFQIHEHTQKSLQYQIAIREYQSKNQLLAETTDEKLKNWNATVH